MPRIRKTRFTHVFIEDYGYYNVKIGTKCIFIKEHIGIKGKPISEVQLENGNIIECFSRRIQSII